MIIGCSRSTSDYPSVALDFDDSSSLDTIRLSEFVDSITYINLRSNDESLMMGDIDNIRFVDSLMILFDGSAQRIYLFDDTGLFLNRIGSRGKGHGEYLEARRIDVDTVSRHVLVYDRTKSSVLRYTFDGHFDGLDSIGLADDFVYIGDKDRPRYLVASYNEWQHDKAGVFLVEPKSGIRQRLDARRDKIAFNSPWEFFKGGHRISVMTSAFENRIMEWSGDSLSTIMDFDIAGMPSQSIMETMVPRDHIKYYLRMSFQDGQRWHYSVYWRDNEYRFMLWDKKTGNIKVSKLPPVRDDGIRMGSAIPVSKDGAFVYLLGGKSPEDYPRIQLFHLKK